MMKKTIFISIFAATMLFAACVGNSSKATADGKKDCCAGVYSPKTVLDSAKFLLDKQIRIKANVTHVCCSGKKLTFTDMRDTTVMMRVLVGGEIEKFNKCLMGQHANITGYLRMNKITKETLDSNEAKVAEALAEATEKLKTDASLQERCDALKAKLESVKAYKQEQLQWMADNKTDFVPDYYFEAEQFADCCKKKNDPEAMAQAAEQTDGCGGHDGCKEK